MMQGTPYIYEGEELGMTNAHFESIDEYKDVEALDIFREFYGKKRFFRERYIGTSRLEIKGQCENSDAVG